MNRLKIFKLKPILFLSIFILIFTISGTIAYFYREKSLSSQFKSMLYNVDIQEDFYNDWGEKKVTFLNQSSDDSPVVLRINFNEMWSNLIISQNVNEYENNNIPSNGNDTNGPSNNQDSSQTESYSYIPRANPFLKDSFYNNIDILSNTINGENVVIKDWTDDFINDFILGDDGWYYYKKVLNSNDEVTVLNSINLNLPLLYDYDEKEKYINYEINYDSNNDEYSLGNGPLSTSNYNYPYFYNLTFSFEAIQANSDAVSQIWNKSITINNGNVTWNF